VKKNIKHIQLFEEYTENSQNPELCKYVKIKDSFQYYEKKYFIVELFKNTETDHIIQAYMDGTCIGIRDDPEYFINSESDIDSPKIDKFIKLIEISRGMYDNYKLKTSESLFKYIWNYTVSLILDPKKYLFILIDGDISNQKFKYVNIFELGNMLKYTDIFLSPMVKYILDKAQRLNAHESLYKFVEILKKYVPNMVPDYIDKSEDESELF
jgi:hypothetical protein